MAPVESHRIEVAEQRFLTEIRQGPLGRAIPEPQTTESTATLDDEKAPLLTASKSTLLYLAYGSNLCDETFLGKRKIQPLSATNVLVPSLRLTFDLPGVPYIEPCFANSARRTEKNGDDETQEKVGGQDGAAGPTRNEPDHRYHKDRWTKGLVGVAYEVTREDFARIIATEGGGSAYQDICVECFPLDANQSMPVPEHPMGPTIKAHTLFAPVEPEDNGPVRIEGRWRRPDPAYAQASARYLKLITDGAVERKLPFEYQEYLKQLQPFTITTRRQAVGQALLKAVFIPLITMVFALNAMFADKKGRSPPWVRAIQDTVFRSVWVLYDYVLKPLFGDGERTIEDKS